MVHFRSVLLNNPSSRLLYVIAMMILLSVASMGLLRIPAFGQEREQSDDRVSTPLKRRAVHLYFSDRPMQYLMAEKRELLCAEDDISVGRCILYALIEGPQRGLVQTLPTGTELEAFFIADDGTAYVNFNDAVSRNHPGGVRSELFTIFTVVNSLALNLSEVNRVQILIGGRQSETLAGHIAISDPFKANILLIR